MEQRVWGVILALCLFLGGAGSVAGQSGNAAAELYRDSGMEQELKQLPKSIVAAMKAEANGLYKEVTEQERAAMIRAVPQAFSESSMRDGIVGAIEKGLSASERSDVLEWLESPTGERMTALEDKAAAPEAVEKLRSYRREGRIENVSEERLELIDRYVRGTNMVERYVDSVIGIRLGMLAGVLATQAMERDAFEQRLSTISQRMEEARPQLREQFSGRVRTNAAFTYRDASLRELRRYIAFLESEVGVRYINVTSEALHAELKRAAARYGRILSEALEQTPAPSSS